MIFIFTQSSLKIKIHTDRDTNMDSLFTGGNLHSQRKEVEKCFFKPKGFPVSSESGGNRWEVPAENPGEPGPEKHTAPGR